MKIHSTEVFVSTFVRITSEKDFYESRREMYVDSLWNGLMMIYVMAEMKCSLLEYLKLNFFSEMKMKSENIENDKT